MFHTSNPQPIQIDTHSNSSPSSKKKRRTSNLRETFLLFVFSQLWTVWLVEMQVQLIVLLKN